jgi:hypothetical protein
MKAIDIIEKARSYYLLSNDHMSKPVHIGSRIKLEFALQDISSKMIIMTAGTYNRCLVLVDYSTQEIWELKNKAERKIDTITSGK